MFPDSISKKAIIRKIVLREGVGTSRTYDTHNFVRKKIAKKSKICGVRLCDFKAREFETFLLGRV